MISAFENKLMRAANVIIKAFIYSPPLKYYFFKCTLLIELFKIVKKNQNRKKNNEIPNQLQCFCLCKTHCHDAGVCECLLGCCKVVARVLWVDARVFWVVANWLLSFSLSGPSQNTSMLWLECFLQCKSI